jgi:DNA-binding PadR family transcriptional regulator
VFEFSGVPRMAGRVWGALLIAEEPELSSADLVARLHASSGSISTATRYLLDSGLIERRRRPGERRDYFAASSAGLSRIMRRRQVLISQMVALADRGLETFGDRPAARPRLEDVREFYAWFDRELPALMDRWEQQQRSPEIPPAGKPTDPKDRS